MLCFLFVTYLKRFDQSLIVLNHLPPNINARVFGDKVGMELDGMDSKDASATKNQISRIKYLGEVHLQGFCRPPSASLSLFLNSGSFKACLQQGIWYDGHNFVGHKEKFTLSIQRHVVGDQICPLLKWHLQLQRKYWERSIIYFSSWAALPSLRLCWLSCQYGFLNAELYRRLL